MTPSTADQPEMKYDQPELRDVLGKLPMTTVQEMIGTAVNNPGVTIVTRPPDSKNLIGITFREGEHEFEPTILVVTREK